MSTKYLKNPVVWLAIIAALVYSSWPLGYILNPTAAHNAFASQLEAAHQPYNWVFIALDILSGVCLLVCGILQWAKSKGFTTKLSISSYMLFAVLVIAAALIPFNCNSAAGACLDVAHSPLLIIHGLASTVSVAALLVSVALIVKLLADRKSIYRLRAIPMLIITFWVLVGVAALGRYHHSDENIVQYIFISLCSMSLIVSLSLIEHLSPRKQPVLINQPVSKLTEE